MSAPRRMAPAGALRGNISLPGDKSISHRYAMLAAVAEGVSRIGNYSSGADCQSTLGCLRGLGVPVERQGGQVVIRGGGLRGFREPAATLEAGNSGSTIRMLSGLLAGQPFTSRIEGDESLSRRPMARILKPLREMGARALARDGSYPPIEIQGGDLQAIDYTLPVASAQVKTCVLFAGLYARGWTTVREPTRTRDHSEIALAGFGARVRVEGLAISVEGFPTLQPRDLTVPGDLSSAAFFLAAALLVPGSEITIQGVGLNPTRAGLLQLLRDWGADLEVAARGAPAGEPVGDVAIRWSPVRGGVIDNSLTAALIDEIPVLAVLGAASQEGLVVRDAAELRVKETDRIATVAENLGRMGVRVEALPDGLQVPGRQRFLPAELDSFGDHRIAMAFAVASLAAAGECTIRGADAASVSYPEFYDTLAGLVE